MQSKRETIAALTAHAATLGYRRKRNPRPGYADRIFSFSRPAKTPTGEWLIVASIDFVSLPAGRRAISLPFIEDLKKGFTAEHKKGLRREARLKR